MATAEEQAAARMVEAVRFNSCATLAGAMIAASGRPHSVNETLKLCHDLRMAMMPPVEGDRYRVWKENFKGDEPHK
jgi:hypothetical protein